MFTRNDALAAETYWANALHVPEDLVHAEAQVESRHNPYAIGDHGTSFGDFQLHRGGLLGSLTPQQAFDPFINARIAVSQLASTIQRNPNVHDPGTLAALSQRPADPSGYARKVDQAMTAQMQTGPAGSSNAGVQTNQLAGLQLTPFGVGGWVWDHTGGKWVLHGVGNVAGDVGGAIAAPFVAIFNFFKSVWDFFTSADTWIRIALFVGGGILVVIGLKAIVGGGGAMPVPVPV